MGANPKKITDGMAREALVFALGVRRGGGSSA